MGPTEACCPLLASVHRLRGAGAGPPAHTDGRSPSARLHAAQHGSEFLFLNTRDLLGHYLEYTWMTDASWAQVGRR